MFTRWLGAAHVTLREDLCGRWVKFYKSLYSSPSPEVEIVARIAAADVRSTTADNNRFIFEKTGLRVDTARPRTVQEELRNRDTQMSDDELIKAGDLSRLLQLRAELHRKAEDTTNLTREINNIASG